MGFHVTLLRVTHSTSKVEDQNFRAQGDGIAGHYAMESLQGSCYDPCNCLRKEHFVGGFFSVEQQSRMNPPAESSTNEPEGTSLHLKSLTPFPLKLLIQTSERKGTKGHLEPT